MRRYLLPIAALLTLGAAGPDMLRRLTSGVATTYIYVDGGLPNPGVTPGPAWATMINRYLLAVDAHDHTSGKGHTVPVAGLNFNDDVNLGDYALKNANYVELSDDGVTGPLRLYSNGTDLYFQTGNAIDIRITDELHSKLAVRSIDGNYQSGPGDLTYTASSDEYTFTPDGGSSQLSGIKTGRLKAGVSTPSGGSYPVTLSDTDAVTVLLVDTNTARTVNLPTVTNNTGRILIIKDKTGSANSNNITVSRNGSPSTIDGSSTATISTNYGVLRLVCDGSNWFTL
jgi:hypothetical protein